MIEPVIHTENAKYSALIGGEHLFNQTAQTFQYLKQRVASGELVLKMLYHFRLLDLKNRWRQHHESV